MFFVYVIENEEGKRYTGQTANIEIRLKRHNGELSTKKSSYTSKNKGNWKILYKEEYLNRQEAIDREKFLKSHVGREWLKSKLLVR